VFGCETLWIESIANFRKISLSGKFCFYFTDVFITQSPRLARKKITYQGRAI